MAELTGRKVLAIVVGAFGVIIAVNLLLAYKAVTTFPGLVVANSYVASQDFDSAKTAQLALGWTLKPDYDAAAKSLRLDFTDAQGLPAPIEGLSVLVGRPTEGQDDSRPQFMREAGAFIAPLDLRPGRWMLQIEAISEDGTLFRQRLNLFVKG